MMKKPLTLKIMESIKVVLIVIIILVSFLNCQPENKDDYTPPPEEEVSQTDTLPEYF